MPLLAYLLHRNADVAHAEFVHHYRAVHSPLSVEAMPQQTSYTANVGREHGSADDHALAAVAFVGLDDVGILADPERLYASSELGERLNADGAYLFSGMDGYVVEVASRWGGGRIWPIGQASPGVQRISLFVRARDLDNAEFRRRCVAALAPLARAEDPAVLGGALSFVAEVVTPDAPALDAIVEVRYRTDDEMAERAPAVDAAYADLVDPAASRSLIADQTIWID
jgi:hypothetical protein